MSRLDHLRKQGFRCYYCQYQWPTSRAAITRVVAAGGPRAPTWDHKVPRSRAGADIDDNKVICCQQCNSEKAHLTEAEFKTARRSGRHALLVARAMTLHLTQPEER